MTRARVAKAAVAAAAATAIVGLAACTGGDAAQSSPREPTLSAGASVSAPTGGLADPEGAAAMLPAIDAQPPTTLHVADGIPPPTNRWYSALAFGEQANPAFAEPLMITARDGGLVVGLPTISGSADAITATPGPTLQIHVEGGVGRPVVSRADPVGVGLTARDGDGADLVEYSAAAGWPAIGLTGLADATVLVSAPLERASGGAWVATIDGSRFVVVVDRAEVSDHAIDLEPGGTAVIGAVPEGGDAAAVAAALGDPVEAVEVAMGVGGIVATKLTYADSETVLAVPEGRTDGLECELGTYASVTGELHACRGRSMRWEVPAVAAPSSVDLSGASDEEIDAVRTALESDAMEDAELPPDTYFGAKALYRLATLAMIADELREERLRDELVGRLGAALTTWSELDGCETRDERCFEYDPTMRGVVGQQPAFGSEQFNDHHFHYGYFIAAAATAVALDPTLEEAIAPAIDLLAADIASTAASESFPALRVFDPFAGHSWASGTAPFAAGNNQESSSEAVLAWSALASWARTRGDDGLERTAQWMLALEADAAERLWVAPDLSAYPEYAHEIVSLTWGGAREYATWFSDEPSAKLGIQLIPMAPVQAHLAPGGDGSGSALTARVEEAGGATPGLPLADYVLMYSALAGPDARASAWSAAATWPDEAIDGGNSRTYLLAWIAAAPR
ncbi:glycosyl hydrolase [Demequina sp. NBRC 110053]|uniref:glycosyl hydrolase n=1 Tax=Demequina sp. NBRC 110053 TaxID=1570342 RepID=UPI000A02AE18|nr:glycosyl hydrolase [Demequina sp. NBRC 110053]